MAEKLNKAEKFVKRFIENNPYSTLKVYFAVREKCGHPEYLPVEYKKALDKYAHLIEDIL